MRGILDILGRAIDAAVMTLYGRSIRGMFLGGTTPKEALATGARERAKGRLVTYHLAFEDAACEFDARLAADTIVEQIEMMSDADRGNVAVKLSQLGMGFSPAKAAEHLFRILWFARRSGIEVEIDAESRRTLDVAYGIVANAATSGFIGTIRAALQMHLPEDERAKLASTHGIGRFDLRIVKGAGVYREERHCSRLRGRALFAAYERMFRDLIAAHERPYMATVADSTLARAMRAWAAEIGVPIGDAYVLQKLYGPIGEGMMDEHVALGGKASVYITFVDYWCPNADIAFHRRRARYLWTRVLALPFRHVLHPLRRYA